MEIYTYIEEYINVLYKNLMIHCYCQLNIENVAKALELNVFYGDCSFRIDDNIMIKQSTKQKEWQDFGHEVCHYLRHEGNQLKMFYMFRDFQEWQADYFAYHFCVPTFILEQLDEINVQNITSLFNVEYDFAMKRLEMYERKIIDARAYS